MCYISYINLKDKLQNLLFLEVLIGGTKHCMGVFLRLAVGSERGTMEVLRCAEHFAGLRSGSARSHPSPSGWVSTCAPGNCSKE